MSCIDPMFCTNQSAISNHGVDASIFDKCYHNIIYGKIKIHAPLLPIYVREQRSGIIKKQILKISRKQHLSLKL